MHGGSIDCEGRMVRGLQYSCQQGQIANSLLAVSFQLTDQPPLGGGFCLVKGSHKINVPPAKQMLLGQDAEFNHHVYLPQTKAGDVLIFSEATIHGCMPWTHSFQRRIALYRFSPSTHAFARGYI